MNKIRKRAVSVLLLVALLIVGMGFYMFELFRDGSDWASFSANQGVYDNGSLSTGTITDRNGVVLSAPGEGGRVYNDDPAVRRAVLHAVGDRWGNIGTGALYVFSSKLIGYDIVQGTYSVDGSGKTLELAIDADLNVAALSAMNGCKGTVAVADCETGEIICMVSSPTYDPDNEPENFDSEEYDGAFLNRFLSASLTPGSTFKLITMAAAIENIPDLFDRSFTCEGTYSVGSDVVTCTGVHGSIDAEEALAVSCNCAFAQIALELGSETLCEYAERYGFTESFEIDGVKTVAGHFEAAPEGSVDLAWSGIGQFTDLVNPAAMLRFVSAIANGGKAPELTMLKNSKTAKTERIIDADTAARLSEMMNYAVYRTYGTDNFPGITMYAKSGTAEVAGEQPHAWFTGYGVYGDRTLSFVVVLENGGYGGVTAGSVANTVLQKAFGLS